MDARGKGRRNRNRKYGQALLRHSRLGIQSCSYAVSTFVIFCILIGNAFATRGMAPGIVGGIAFLSICLPILGIRSGLRGLREREKKYITCKAGIAFNIAELIFFGMIFIRGVR